ncbi:hypothetical protein [Moorena producens]|uniref:hypothetical protein n=1 Tax=Moorena producens TaxID=1155739 RepID=UPI003C72ABEF
MPYSRLDAKREWGKLPRPGCIATPYSLLPTPYSLLPDPLFPVPYSLSYTTVNSV